MRRPSRLRRAATTFVTVALVGGGIAALVLLDMRARWYGDLRTRAERAVAERSALVQAGEPDAALGRLRGMQTLMSPAVLVLQGDRVLMQLGDLRRGDLPRGLRVRAQATVGSPTSVRSDASVVAGQFLDADDLELYVAAPTTGVDDGIRHLTWLLGLVVAVVAAGAAYAPRGARLTAAEDSTSDGSGVWVLDTDARVAPTVVAPDLTTSRPTVPADAGDRAGETSGV